MNTRLLTLGISALLAGQLPTVLRAQVDTWIPITPEGVSVDALAFDPSRPQILFAATQTSFSQRQLVSRSQDAGRSWEPVLDADSPKLPTPPLPDSILQLVVAPSDSMTVYAQGRRGSWRSFDGGDSWERIEHTTGALSATHRLTVDPSDARRLWLATTGGAFVSNDGGATWRASGGLPAPASVIGIGFHPAAPGELYTLHLNAGLFRFSAAGVWQRVGGPPPGAAELSGLAFDAGDPDGIYVATAATHRASGVGIFFSPDGGATWEPRSEGLPDLSVRWLAAHPSVPGKLWAATESGLAHSDDGGQSWSGSPADLPIRPLWVVPHPTNPAVAWVAARGSGLFGTADGGTSWDRSSRGLPAPPIFDLAVGGQGGPALIGTVFGGVYTTREEGRSWTFAGEGRFLSAVAVDPVDPKRLLSRQNDRILHSADGGRSWREATRSPDNLLPFRFLYDPHDRETLYATGTPVRFRAGPGCSAAKSEDRGETWRCLLFDQGHISALAVDSEERDRLVAGKFRSEDGGETWLASGAGLENPVFALLADPATPGGFFAGTAEGLFHSLDGGETYQPVELGLAPEPVFSIANCPSRPDTLFVAAASGVLVSEDRGSSWAGLGDEGLPGFVEKLSIHPERPDTVYALASEEIFKLTRSRPLTCRADGTTLCLSGGRFRVDGTWRDPRGRSGTARVVPLTTGTGALWFFREGNLEAIVKVLDGRPVNGHHWVFYAGLSNVEYWIRVTDTTTGESRTYHNPPGRLASRGDTEAFAATRAASGAGAGDELPALSAVHRDGFAPPGGCDPGELCLRDERFRARVEWTDFTGRSGSGTAVPLYRDTGAFWFFGPRNIELVVKILDGRPVNGSFWIFFASLTNVEFTLTVTDTETGEVRVYRNPPRRFASVADTRAF